MADKKEEVVKLYKIKKGSKIRLHKVVGEELMATFHHLDGAYSYCTTTVGPLHLSASTPLVLKEDGVYELAPPEEPCEQKKRRT